MTSRIRRGAERDVPALTRLVNLAYEAERFFVLGDRTHEGEVRQALDSGVFLVAVDEADVPVGCVHVHAEGERGSFGMLAVAPDRQRQGLGHHLIRAAEDHVRQNGGRMMEILVVDLRHDLRRLYGRLGYREVGARPYVHRQTLQPCHFVVMTRDLEPGGSQAVSPGPPFPVP